MTLNTAHLNGGVLLYNRELVLIYTPSIGLKWSGQNSSPFKGNKKGRLHLTTHRMVFLNKKAKDPMQSFSFPFVALRDISIDQPIFGANQVVGKVIAQENGNWSGEATFKMIFNEGGAIEFAYALRRAAQAAQRRGTEVPPYFAPVAAFIIIEYNYTGYDYDWMPARELFPERPPDDGVIITEEPPPYPGIEPPSPPAAASDNKKRKK